MNELTDRNHYLSDQRISLFGLPLLVGGPLLAGAAVAWILKSLFILGWYLIILVPALGGLALGGMMYLLVGGTHCRNSWLTGGIGVVAGLIGFFGYFYLCMLHLLPLRMAGRFDLLPRYILARMKTDVAVDVGRPQVGNQPKKPFVALNWYAFVFELGMMAGIPAVAGWRRARRAYCPDLRQWMQLETALFPPFTGRPITNAFENGHLEEFLANTPAGGDAQTACQLIVEYAQPKDSSPVSFPMYASVKDKPEHKPWYWPRHARRTYVRQIELRPPEILALRPFFPKLARLLETYHAELRELPANVLPAPANLKTATDVAVIVPVPEPHYKTILTPSYAVKLNLIALTPVAFIASGIGLLALGGYLVSEDKIGLSLLPLVLGGLSLAWGIYIGGFCMGVYENHWVERRLRVEIGSRPDPLVDSNDPDTVYVSITPRENWSQVKWTMASDLLLMYIDPRRREILLEGDCDRYRIPAGAIASCEPQCFFHPIDKDRKIEAWLVRLMIHVENGMRELLLSVGQKGWRPRTNARRRKIAQETCEKIDALQAS